MEFNSTELKIWVAKCTYTMKFDVIVMDEKTFFVTSEPS